MKLDNSGRHNAQHIAPSDIIIGLVVVERGMLSTFLALFDDGKLKNQRGQTQLIKGSKVLCKPIKL